MGQVEINFNPNVLSLRKLIEARDKFRKYEWDEEIGLPKPLGYDELPLISTGWLHKRTKQDEIQHALGIIELAVEKRKTLLIEQHLKELDDLRFMSNDTNE